MEQAPERKINIPVFSLIKWIVFLMILRPNPRLIDKGGTIELLMGALLYLIPIIFFLTWIIGKYHFKKDGEYIKKLSLPTYVKVSFLGISSWIIITGLLSLILGTSNLSFLNLGELFRYPVYFLIFAGGYYAALFVSREQMFKWVSWATFISCIIALIQLFSVPYIHEFLLKIYGNFKLRPLAISLTNFRVYGSFRNANWFGIFLVLMLPFILSHYRKYPFFHKIFAYGIVIVGILISGSRSAWIGAILIMFMYLFCFFAIKERKDRRPFRDYIIPLAFIFLILFSSLIYTGATQYYQRWNEFVNFLSNPVHQLFPSAEHRLAAWGYYINMAFDRPILGFGPSQDWIGITDNGYIVLLIKYGIPSLMFLFLFLGGMIKESFLDKTFFSLALGLSVIALAYGNINQDLLNTVQVISIALYLYGFSVADIHLKKPERSKSPF